MILIGGIVMASMPFSLDDRRSRASTRGAPVLGVPTYDPLGRVLINRPAI
jgi:hypothetical protein